MRINCWLVQTDLYVNKVDFRARALPFGKLRAYSKLLTSHRFFEGYSNRPFVIRDLRLNVTEIQLFLVITRHLEQTSRTDDLTFTLKF